jgi:phosphoglycolate phosphatase
MTPLPKLVEAVLFDLDGTLVETSIDFALMRREMLALAAAHGLDPEPMALLDILAIVDHSAETLARQDRPDEGRNLRAEAMRILEEIELRHANATTEIPTATKLIGALREAGIGVGIVTRNCRKASDISLGMVGIRPDVIICREDTDLHKPHPEPLLQALKVLNATPERSIMIGDHLMDIQSGKAAGTATIAFLRENRPPDFFDRLEPDMVVHSLEEVLGAIIDCHS